jgi:tetratricopeptide (TPR) repeat protein
LDQFAGSDGLAGAALAKAALGPWAPRPYEVWRQISDALAAQGVSPPPDMTAAYRTVLRRLASGARSSDLAAQPLPPLPGEQARYRVYDAMGQLLASAAKAGPVVLLIDDLHHADGPSLKLLRHLLPFIASIPILIVAAFDDEDPSWTELAQLRGAVPNELPSEHLVLGGLTDEAVRQLLPGAALGDEGAAFARALAGLTRGVPLHVLLLARLIEGLGHQGAKDGSGRALSDLKLVATSARRTFGQIVASQLSAAEQAMVEAAAIFPDGFSPADVASLAGISEAEASAALERIEAKSVLTEPDPTAGLYRFRHPMFRRVLLDRMDLDTQASLIGSAISLWSRRDEEGVDCWQMAAWSHAVRSSPQAETGLSHCLRAAQDADALGAPELRHGYLAKARELLDAGGRFDLKVLTDHALAAADMVAFEEASRSAWQAVEGLDGQGGEQASALDLLVTMAVELHDRGAGEDVWEPLRSEALERLGDQHDCRWARLRLLEGGGMNQISGPPLQAGRWTGLDQDAVHVVRTQGDEHDYCRTLLVYDWLGVDDVDDLLERARRWTSPLNLARALSVAAETLMYRHGGFDRACALLEEQRDLHAKSGSIVEQAKSLVRLTMAQLAAGELEAATATRGRARDMVARLGPGYLIYEHAGTTRGGDLYPEISMESNFAWYLEGDWLAVAEHWAQAVSIEEPGGSPVHIVEAAMAAQAYARLHRFQDARTYLDELTIVLKQLEPRDWAFNGAVGRASHAIWDMAAVDYAGDYRDFALRLLAAGVGDWTNTSLELTVARMAALLDRHDEASAYFESARAKLGAKDKDPRRAIVDFDQAVALRMPQPPEDGRREALLHGALSTFQERGMNGWVQRTTDELHRS